MNRRRVLALAIPIIGENFLQTLVGTADTVMVTRLGKEEVAGVGTSLEFIFFILAALSAVSIGATVLVSQATGAGDHSLVNRYARQAIVWGVIAAIPGVDRRVLSRTPRNWALWRRGRGDPPWGDISADHSRNLRRPPPDLCLWSDLSRRGR